MIFNPYGLTLALAFFIAFFLTSQRAKRRGLNSEFVWESLPWVLGFSLLGARLYHVTNFYQYYLSDPLLIPQVWLGGLGIWGGIGGGLLGLLVKFKNQRSKIKINKEGSTIPNFLTPNQLVSAYLDCAAPGIALAQAIGRLGNVWNGENLPYAYWEMATNLLIFFFLIFLERFNLDAKVEPQRRETSGRLFFLYLLCYSTARFVLEFFRLDSPWIFGPLTVAQWVSLIVILIILGWFSWIRLKKDIG